MSNLNEEFNFDKHMDDILIKENVKNSKVDCVDDSDMRKRAARHQDRPANKIRIR
jgi:hypothetical protein